MMERVLSYDMMSCKGVTYSDGPNDSERLSGAITEMSGGMTMPRLMRNALHQASLRAEPIVPQAWRAGKFSDPMPFVHKAHLPSLYTSGGLRPPPST